MQREEIWQAVDAQRLDLTDVLEGLTARQWEQPSLCPGWRVRDVAAHLTLGPLGTIGWVTKEFVRARGDFNRMIHTTAVERGRLPVDRIVADLRSIVGSRRLALGTSIHEPLLDILVHGQDIAIPLGIERKMPLDAARSSAERVWRKSFPFRARRRLHGLRLSATDIAWDRGAGEPVEGPIWALLLALTGRPAALPHLTGAGVDLLRRRLQPDEGRRP